MHLIMMPTGLSQPPHKCFQVCCELLCFIFWSIALTQKISDFILPGRIFFTNLDTDSSSVSGQSVSLRAKALGLAFIADGLLLTAIVAVGGIMVLNIFNDQSIKMAKARFASYRRFLNRVQLACALSQKVINRWLQNIDAQSQGR